ncbi:Uncharacterized protein Fot_22020, partial [Forsythia ovata]
MTWTPLLMTKTIGRIVWRQICVFEATYVYNSDDILSPLMTRTTFTADQTILAVSTIEIHEVKSLQSISSLRLEILNWHGAQLVGGPETHPPKFGGEHIRIVPNLGEMEKLAKSEYIGTSSTVKKDGDERNVRYVFRCKWEIVRLVVGGPRLHYFYVGDFTGRGRRLIDNGRGLIFSLVRQNLAHNPRFNTKILYLILGICMFKRNLEIGSDF